jgi:hypothetical protein
MKRADNFFSNLPLILSASMSAFYPSYIIQIFVNGIQEENM